MSGEKAPSKKKVPKIKEIKKPLIIGGIVSIIAIAGIVTGIYFLLVQDRTEEENVFILGVYRGPQSCDTLLWPFPQNENWYMWDQVAEGLFDYDQRKILNGTHPIIYNLAISANWSDDALNFTCKLRKGVKFHDGTPFNATAVKWNFDRLYRLFDNPDAWNNLSWWIPMLWYIDFVTPIINETIVLDEYTVRFVLNEPFVPFQSLLMHRSAYILSPTSTPPNRILNSTYLKTMVGTGPFMLDSFMYRQNTTLVANPDYWGGKPEIDMVILETWQEGEVNHTARKEKMLSGYYSLTYGDYEDDVRQIFIDDPSIDVYTLRTDSASYLWMNNEVINATMRRACSYAFNYTHYLEKFLEFPSSKDRLKSYVPHDYLYANWTAFDVPDYNIQIARQILKDAEWPGTETLTVNSNISAGNEWEQLVNIGKPLANYTTAIIYDEWEEDHTWIKTNTSHLLAENLKQIGVNVELLNVSWDELGNSLLISGKVDFLKGGYLGDYNDPNNVLYPMFSNNSWLNFYNFYDPLVQQWLEEGLGEIDSKARKQIYYHIQKRLIEELCPFIMLETDFTYLYWNINVGGVLSALRSLFSFPLKDLYII